MDLTEEIDQIEDSAMMVSKKSIEHYKDDIEDYLRELGKYRRARQPMPPGDLNPKKMGSAPSTSPQIPEDHHERA